MRALLVVSLVAVPLAARPGAQGEPARNVVVLLADDAGYADFGFQVAPDPQLGPLTPRIDSIARDGVRFTDAYVSGCVCSPSRAGLLTGRYQQRFGHEHNIPPGYMAGGLDLGEQTIGDRLASSQRATGLIGKWHLGYPPAYHPNRRGFTHFVGLLQGSRSYLPIAEPSPYRVIQHNGEPLPEAGYVTDRFATAAVEFIAAHRDQPFFLLVSFTAVHGPLQAKAEDLEAVAHVAPERRRRYAGLMVALDRAVGQVLDALAAHGLDADTLVVFTNDNGGQTGTGAVNRPLRGRKGQLWEGGIRVPLAMRWPGRIVPDSTIAEPVILLDLLPTLVSACGGEVRPEWRLDGIDLLPRLCDPDARLPERTLFWRSDGAAGPVAARRGRFKLLVERGAVAAADPPAAVGESMALFDLAADVGERQDLAASETDAVASLRAAIAAWEGGLVEPRW